MADYGKMTQTEFVEILAWLVDENPASHLLTLPGVYEAVAEHFNNDVLDVWAEVHPPKYRIVSDRFGGRDGEPVTMDEFEKMCEDNGWEFPMLRRVVRHRVTKEGTTKTPGYVDAQTRVLILEEVP
jgi:hypothetical protein